jgi:hypothetical protein
MALIAGQINPANYPQPNYSGVVQSAQMQAREMANIGAGIGGAIREFGEAKKEQKKVDAYNKASAKAIEAAITLGGSYGITGAEKTLRPFLEAYNDPSLSPIEKAALLDEGKGMIPNVFGRFDAKQADAIQRAQLDARNDPSSRSVNLQQGEITETIDGKAYKVPITFNPATGETRRLDGSIVGQGFQSPDVIDAGLNLPMPSADGTIMPGSGIYPNYGSFEEAMVLPSRNDADAIATAAGLTGGQSDVSNVSPMPAGTPTVVQAPNVDGPPIGMTGLLPQLPPGAVPIEVKPDETYEQNVEAGGLYGQRNTKTGEFKAYPGQTGGRIIRFNPETGQVEITEGSGAGAKAEGVAKAQEQMKGESFRLNQANTEEAFGRLDVAGTNNPLFAAGNSLLAKALPASEVGELESFFERINVENSFEKMNKLRASSPTGGAAGTMTEKEWPRFEGRFSPLKANARKDTLAKSLSLNLLNAFEATNGTPDDVIKLLDEKKIDQAAYDNYVNDYIRNRQIARVNANGVEGKSYDWTKLNKKLLSKSTIFEAPASSSPFTLSPEAEDVSRRHPTGK